MPIECTSAGRRAKGASRAETAAIAAARPSRVIGSSSRACPVPTRRGSAVASFISAMGVIPAIGSFEKDPME